MTFAEIALAILHDLIAKSGVREWEQSPEWRASLTNAALEMAAQIYYGATAMATKTLMTPMDGTPKQICFADHATDFSPTAANDLRVTTDGSFETDCQMLLENVASGNGTTTGGWQSAKVDLGAKWAREYKVRAAFELAATPTAGYTINLFWAPSSSATAATGNAAGVSGSSAAYTGYANNNLNSLKQLTFIGAFVCTAQATGTIQVAEVGVFAPLERYGSLVIYNASGAAFHSDSAEHHVVFDPILEEFQA